MTRLINQRAVVMLMAVVLWTAAPLIACVPGFGTHSRNDCCATMAMADCGAMAMADCGSDSMAGAPCCQLAPKPISAMPGPVTTPKHGQDFGEPIAKPHLLPVSNPEVGQPGFNEAPPPDPSPGGISVLRI